MHHNPNPHSALVIGRHYSLHWMLPALLARAGFAVDVLARSALLGRSRFVRGFTKFSSTESLLEILATKRLEMYDWIVIAEDQLLTDVLQSDLLPASKLKILPVVSAENFSHLHSKIGLAQVFEKHRIPTPAFFAVHSLPEALMRAESLGYPVLLKKDASSGGAGVFECRKPPDLKNLPAAFWTQPLLLQKKIQGREFDLSAIFLKGQLVHFNNARVEATTRRFGPSAVRAYTPMANSDPAIFGELAAIGKALGIHGFTNISCLEDADGKRHYIEADLRPNAWVDFPKFFGEDPAPAIRAWFERGETLNPPSAKTPSATKIIPHFLRVPRWQLITNRNNVWRYLPREDAGLLTQLMARRMLAPVTQAVKHYADSLKRVFNAGNS